MHTGSQDLKKKRKKTTYRFALRWVAELQKLTRKRCLSAPSLSHTWLCNRVDQASLCMEFSRQEYWSELPFPPPGESSQPRGQCLLGLLGWQVDSLPLPHLGSPYPADTGQQHGNELNTCGSWQHVLWLQAIGNYLNVKALKRLVERPFKGSTSAQLWNEWGRSLWTDMKWFSGYTVSDKSKMQKRAYRM